MLHIKPFLLTSLILLLLSTTVYSNDSSDIIGAQLPEEVGDKILSQLNKGGVFGATVDLNVRVTIPEEKNPHATEDANLWATIIRPNKSYKQKLPTILIATPYHREFMQMFGITMVSHGYILMTVDVRGSGSSEGEWTSFDLIEHWDMKYIIDEWIPSRDWSDGKVGMIGPSYMGIVQLYPSGIVDRDENGEPIHLKAIYPQTPTSDPYRDIVYHGGSLDMEFIPFWLGAVDILSSLPPLLYLGEDCKPNIENIREAANTWITHINQIPKNIKWVTDYENRLDGPFYDKKSAMLYWPIKPEGGWDIHEGDNFTIPKKLPALLTVGWFDIFTRGSLDYYQYGLSEHSNSDKGLIIGEWYHLAADFGLGVPSMVSQQFPARWFDWKIKGKDDCFMKDFPVLLEVMGIRRWRAEKSWPLPESRVDSTTYYLSKMKADPIEDDWFTNNPKNQIYFLTEDINECDLDADNPVLEHTPSDLHGTVSRSSTRWLMGIPTLPSEISRLALGIDIDHMNPFEDERNDDWKILTFTTEPLKEDLEIIGPLCLKFWAETQFNIPLSQYIVNQVLWMIKNIFSIELNALLANMNEKDVQWVVELNDVFPDGKARNITSGWLRASHRQYDPNESSSLMEHPIDPGYTPFDPFYDRPDKEPVHIEEGELYQYAVELWPTCNLFKKGHSIRLTISGSDFPHLLPILIPSKNTILIDDDHLATLDFDVVNEHDEGITWKWVEGNMSKYLLTHRDYEDTAEINEEDDSPEEEALPEEAAISKLEEPDEISGCGFSANASTGNESTSALPGSISTLVFMLLTLSIVMIHRVIRKRKAKLKRNIVEP